MPSLHQFDWSVRDIEFLLWEQFKLNDNLLNNETLDELGINQELITTLLYQAKQFAVKELDPINTQADQEGCYLDEQGKVVLPSVFVKAWDKYKQAGWTELANPIAEGISLPQVACQAYLELFFGACPSFMLYGGFGVPIAQLLKRFGNTQQKASYIDKLLTLKWSSCFCLTEPQAGSDIGGIRTRALPQDDGTYLLEGEKIFITAGMHDLVENILYLVVARIEGAPKGTPGLSCFLVTRFELENGQTSTKSNGVTATRIEKKMGMSACATTALSFGLDAPCKAYLLGDQENAALKQIASLMSLARMSTGLISLGIASSAYQNAASYSQQRFQGSNVRQSFNPAAQKIPIVQHADVKRMLLEMKSKVEGCRALLTKLSYHYTFAQYNTKLYQENDQDNKQSNSNISLESLERHERWIALLTPLVKAYISNQAWRVSELAIQVYGGHGYIKDNPVEQAARDCKILAIWEGTNFLQSAELVREKCAMGRPSPLLDQALTSITEFLADSDAKHVFPVEAENLGTAIKAIQSAHSAIGGYTKERQIEHIFFNSTRFLDLLSETIIAWLLLDGALIANNCIKQESSETVVENNMERLTFLKGRITSMEYFLNYELPVTVAEANIICHAKPMVMDVDTTIFN